MYKGEILLQPSYSSHGLAAWPRQPRWSLQPLLSTLHVHVSLSKIHGFSTCRVEEVHWLLTEVIYTGTCHRFSSEIAASPALTPLYLLLIFGFHYHCCLHHCPWSPTSVRLITCALSVTDAGEGFGDCCAVSVPCVVVLFRAFCVSYIYMWVWSAE